jgi:hypothetical protein
MRAFVGLFVSVALAAALDAGPCVSCGPWGNGECVQVGREDVWEWIDSDRENGEGRLELYKNGVFVGFWDCNHAYYRASRPDSWGPKEAVAPFPPPPRGVAAWQLDGVASERINGHDGNTYTINGRPASLQKTAAALEDDSGKLWLTVIGAQADRKSFLDEAKKTAPDLLSRCRLWSVDPGHFSLQDRDTGKTMFPGDGKLIVYLQDQQGCVLYHGDQVSDLRKADPNFKPDPPKPAPVPVQPTQPSTPAPPPLPAVQPTAPSPGVPAPLLPLIAILGGLAVFTLREGA